MSLTIKGYAQNEGLSKFIFEDLKTKNNVYQVTGPMGKGLNPTAGGTHVAYAAGTGVLVFVDLVGHLLLRQVAAAGGPDVLAALHKEPGFEGIPTLPDDFKLELHTSFFDLNEGIALELIEALQGIDPDKKVFEHFGQFQMTPDGQRAPMVLWDEGYYTRVFQELVASKIWVCGPPIMQEGFDRAVMATSNAKVDFAAL